MTKIIERPDSTTVMMEFPFHVIKSLDEARNVFLGIDPQDIKLVQRLVDKETFMPKYAIVIQPKGVNWSGCLKYFVLWEDLKACNLELVNDEFQYMKIKTPVYRI